jgi:SRSO17 transposase
MLLSFSECFSTPTFETFQVMVQGWLLCRGRRTITRVLLAGGGLRRRSFECYHRFFNRARWSVDALSLQVLRLALELVPAGLELVVAVDDTLTRKNGKRIWGAAMHHDPLRSTARRKQFSFGHSWVVLSLQIPLPFLGGRRIGLPILFRLYRRRVKKGRPPKARNLRQTGGAKAAEYRTRPELAREMICLLASWLPEHTITVVGDMEYGGKSISRHLPANVQLASRMPMNAALYAMPEAKPKRKGRPRKKGDRLPSPKQLARSCKTPWASFEVSIYGKRVSLLCKQFRALWYNSAGPRLLNIVVTRDPKGEWKDGCFFTTDLRVSAEQLLERISLRWPLEVTFHDAKQLLGLEDPQNRAPMATQRTAPFALLVYSLVAIWFAKHGSFNAAAYRKVHPWYRKKMVPSFEDMLECLRTQSVAQRLFANPSRHAGSLEIPALDEAAFLAQYSKVA